MSTWIPWDLWLASFDGRRQEEFDKETQLMDEAELSKMIRRKP